MKKLLAVVGVLTALSWGALGHAAKKGGDKACWEKGGMCADLKLTDSQKEKMKDLVDGKKEEMKSLREALKGKVKELKALLDKKASDKELAAALDEVKKAREELQAARKKWMEKHGEILTPSQRAQLVVKMDGKREMCGEMGEGKGKGKKGEKGKHHGCPMHDK